MKETLTSFRRGWEIFQPFRKKFAVMMVLIMLTQFGWQAGPFIFGKLINTMQTGEPITSAMFLVGVTYLCWMMSLAIALRRQIFQENNLDYDVERYLDSLTLEKFLSLSLCQHRSQSSGITQSVVSKGKNSLETMVSTLVYTLLPITVGIIMTIAALLWFDWIAGLIVLTGTLLYTTSALRFNKKHYPNVRRFNNTGDEVNKNFGELLRNASVVQLNSQEKRVHGEHGERLEKWGEEGQAAWIPYTYGMQPLHLIVFTTRLGLLVYGVYSVYSRGYNIGDFVIIYSWCNQATGDLWQIVHQQRQWLDLWTKVKKYFSVLDVQPKIQIVPNPIPLKHIEGKVEFRSVNYTYSNTPYVVDDEGSAKTAKPNPPALVDLSFTIMPGQRVAFVGRSGAGKSTLLYLLTRSDDPDSGQILVDDNDLRLVDFYEYRRSIGVVEQKALLFDNTIGYNMLFGLNGKAHAVTNEKMERVAEVSRINSFRERLVDGWETRIGDNGVRLSGGECQRVSIARALSKDSRLLLLDEATSNLDGENERYIKEAIRNASEGRTTIIIAHRLSTVRDADRIFVMEKGSVVASGTHDELMDISPIYRTLVHDQLVSL